MSHRHYLTLVGLTLIAIGWVGRGYWFVAVWWGGNFLVLGIAHFLGAHRIFGKRSDGTLPLWSWLVFLPLHLSTSGFWHLLRRLSSEPAYNRVTDDLLIGRRLLPGELDGAFANYVDLTAEFPEPKTIRQSAAYRSFPILDGAAPDPEALSRAVSCLHPGKSYIHCAHGHARTALFALAIMLKSGDARTIKEGLNILRAVRPAINLTAVQRRCIAAFAAGPNYK